MTNVECRMGNEWKYVMEHNRRQGGAINVVKSLVQRRKIFRRTAATETVEPHPKARSTDEQRQNHGSTDGTNKHFLRG